MAYAERPERQVRPADQYCGSPSRKERAMKKSTALAYVILMLLFFPLACSGPGDIGADVEKPALDRHCLSGKCIPDQFQTAYQRFAIITGNMVNLRSRPDITSRVLGRLPVTRKVTVLYIKPGRITIGAMKGSWAYVRDCSNIKLSGWLFDHFLGFTDSFSRPERWKIREIRVIMKGMLTVYQCTPDARFAVVQKEKIYEKDKNLKRETISGEILQCKNVLWLKKDNPDDYPIFLHILKDGKLDVADQYKNTRAVVLVR